MAEVLLFHHAQGLTAGIHAFADALRAAGHVVHTPDLFDGRTFSSIDEGMAHINFADSSLPSYDPDATALLTRRVLDFLARV